MTEVHKDVAGPQEAILACINAHNAQLAVIDIKARFDQAPPNVDPRPDVEPEEDPHFETGQFTSNRKFDEATIIEVTDELKSLGLIEEIGGYFRMTSEGKNRLGPLAERPFWEI